MSREFHEPGIAVSLSDGLYLTVSFVDGPWFDAPCERQAALALRVATSVRRNYADFDALQNVSVGFTHRALGDSMAITSTHPPFRFSRAALQAGRIAADSANALALCELAIGRASTDPF